MTVAAVAAPPAFGQTGAAPAGLNPAQTRAMERLWQSCTDLADLEPLDLDETDAERRWTQWRRWTGEDN